jgi:hypothetical protein
VRTRILAERDIGVVIDADTTVVDRTATERLRKERAGVPA